MSSKKVGILTGHGTFDYHEDKCNPAIGPSRHNDRWCDDPDAIQATKYILSGCEAFATVRVAQYA